MNSVFRQLLGVTNTQEEEEGEEEEEEKEEDKCHVEVFQIHIFEDKYNHEFECN